MMSKNQRGFVLFVILIAISVAVLFAGAGFYYQSRQNVNHPAAPATETEPTKDWKTYADPAGFFEFKYPAAWVLPADLGTCQPGLVRIGANSASAGTCAPGGLSQMQVQAVKGELLRSTYEPIAPYFNEAEIKSESIQVDGVAGLKQLATVVNPSPVYPGLAAGDKILVHIFQHDGYTYVASYNIRQNNPFPDVQKDFETLVLQTLKFR